jgi:phosphoribosylformylglycinamidine synthase
MITETKRNFREKLIDNLQQNNVLSQKGLIEMFDATIGRSTVLMPFGGKTQRTESQVSVQKIPVGNHFTNTASIMAYGYNPNISSWSPYHGAQYSVIEAITKIVAAGGRYNNIRFSFQEYFEKMTQNPFSWGKPTAALLGALQIQHDFKLAAIGGKDSMSGTFQNINVPPMLMAFGITTVDANNVISTDLKAAGNNIYLIEHCHNDDFTPNVEQLKKNYDFISQAIENRQIISACAVGFGGVAEAVCKMAFGNEIGVFLEPKDKTEDTLFNLSYGSVIVEMSEKTDFENAVYSGKTITEKAIKTDSESVDLDALYLANTKKFADIYPIDKSLSL